VRALGIDPVACTRFCEQPDLPAVGGTKNPDVAAIIELAPDVVVVNDEENRREDAHALAAAGLPIHDMSPRSVADVGPAMVALGDALGIAVPNPFPTGPWEAWLGAQHTAAAGSRRRAVVVVWRRPWMTMNADTYASSLLELLAIDNVFADASDRYPTTDLDAIARQRPDVVLLPSEPYPFADRHRAEVAAAVGHGDVRPVDGRDLFWWGIRTPRALARLRTELRPA
jgi:ABC-type Fe3+-hydroxamate transport system substrate-binding protein